jgi:trimeric autotransporter adhesin
MNTIYKLVWNAATGSLVAASELAKGRKKSRTVGALAVAIALGLNTGAAFAANEADTTSTITCAEGQTLVDGNCVAGNVKSVPGTITANGAASTESIGIMGGGFSGSGSGITISATGGAGPIQASATNGFDIAIGNHATANNIDGDDAYKAIAIGSSVTANGQGTIAMGDSVSATASSAVAIGSLANASATNTVALGAGSVASGIETTALGSTASAMGVGATAVGYGANASGSASIAIGGSQSASAQATATHSIAIGEASAATNSGAIALGESATASGSAAVAFGQSASAQGSGSVVIGSGAADNSNPNNIVTNSVAIGNGALVLGAGGSNLTAVGASSSASGTDAAAFGASADASGTYSTALGASTVASGGGVAVGGGASATSGAMAVGRSAQASVAGAVALGQNAQATASNSVALGFGSVANQANTVSVGNGTTNYRIVNMANGVDANDAVNVSQLSPALTALGATMDANGNVTGPTFNLANGGTSTTIGAALTGLDNALSTANTHISDNSSAISSLQDQLESGTVGLVQQDATTGNITVAADTNGSVVDFTGTDGTRTLTGVSAGSVSSTSTDAVNGAQLYGVSESVAKAIGGNAVVNADGTLSAPSFTVGDGNGGTVTVNSLGDAISNVDGRVTTNEGAIGTLTDQLNSGSVGLVQQASVGANLTVGANTNGAAVDFTGTDGMRILTGVANGVGDDDAVTMSQLKAAGLYDPSGDPMTVISYDDHSLASATLGGTNGTVINNLAPGLVAAGSMQAVNGGQLFDLQQNFQSQYDSLNSQYSNLNDRVGTIEQGIVDGTIGGPGGGDGAPGYGPNPGSGDNSVVIGDGANASGDSSTAIGNGSVASGDSSTVVGNGSVASGSNSTASGANAQATGSNSTATGANAVASGAGSTAAGESASATGNNSTALGSNSSATGNNSVALGAGSVADRDNTVSVGAPGAERQITNVAAGTQRTDAANWGQVQDAVNGVQDWANQKFTQMNKRISGMGAMSAASTQMAVNAAGVSPGKGRIAMGVGYQGGQSALSVGYAKAINERARFSIGGAVSGSDANVGVGFGFDL